MSPERQAAAIVGADGVEALSAAGLLIVTADRVAALIDARNEALKHNAILGAMIRDVRAEASADRARLVRYYEDRLRRAAGATAAELRALTAQGPAVVMVSRDDMLRLLDTVALLQDRASWWPMVPHIVPPQPETTP